MELGHSWTITELLTPKRVLQCKQFIYMPYIFIFIIIHINAGH